jgi:putative ABC transport system permease protein
VVAAVFGIVPSLQARGVDLMSTLKAGDARGAVGGRTIGRRILVVAELAFAVMLLAGAGLLVRSFWNLLQQDPGFRTDGVIKAEYQLPATRYPTDFRNWPNFAEQHAFTDRVVARARRLPGVVAVAVAGNHPLDRGFTNSFGIVGRQAPAGGWPELSIRRVTSGYFDTVKLPLTEGRGIGEEDTTRAAPVVVINEAASKRLFPDGRAVGAALRLYGNARTIVGVVADERVHGLGEAPPIAAYLPISQAPSTNGAGVLMVRTAGDASALAGSVTGVIREEDPSLAVFGVEPLAATLSRSLAERRFAAILLVSFSGLALLLGAVGVYGMLSFDIARRRGEIGIRLALGAQPSAILGLMLSQGAKLAAAGVALGFAGAFALSRFLAALLFGVSAQDPMTLATVSVLLLAVALAATAIPAWQAARTDAAAVLRT